MASNIERMGPAAVACLERLKLASPCGLDLEVAAHGDGAYTWHMQGGPMTPLLAGGYVHYYKANRRYYATPKALRMVFGRRPSHV